jgi:chemotaxis protein MotB
MNSAYRIKSGTPDASFPTADILLRELDEPLDAGTESGWAVGYLDVLLLLLTLFAVLLGISYMRGEQPKEGAEGGAWLLSLSLQAPVPAAVADLQPELVLAAYRAQPPVAVVPVKPPPVPQEAPPVDDRGVAVSGEIELTLPEADVPEPLLRFDPKELARLVTNIEDDRLGVEVQEQQVRVEMQDDILFPLGSADLGDRGKALLDKLVDGLGNRELGIWVEGHTDDLPIATERFPSNWELSSQRAGTVARYLIQRGVDSARIQVSGFADTRPRAPNDSPQNRARNRRVSLVLQQWAEEPPKPAIPKPESWTAL